MDASRSRSVGRAVETDLGQSVLDRLAERVRTVRNRRGMSRKVLAHHAQVSERYLAQLEAGKGNISIMLLWRIAHALGVPLAELVEERERSLDAVLLDNLLERLSPEQWADARNLLLARFGASPSAKRRDRIALIGLRGGGKSTIGSLLATHLGAPFVELDREIESTSGMQLGQMFEMFGQETFRRVLPHGVGARRPGSAYAPGHRTGGSAADGRQRPRHGRPPGNPAEPRAALRQGRPRARHGGQDRGGEFRGAGAAGRARVVTM
jgi:transcriptional regulator with XRE-family HTH domain